MKKYECNIKMAVYENACDCIFYGFGFKWLNKCSLSEEEALKIWKQAWNDMAEED